MASISDTLGDRIQTARRAKGWTLERLKYRVYDESIEGTSPSTLVQALKGRRGWNIALVERVAEALEVDPAEWPEYRLMAARRDLDERQVGMDQALANLERYQAGLEALSRRRAAEQRKASADARSASGRPPGRAGGSG